jgi:hypothetical protein
MDYVQMPDRLIERADPIQRQLLGHITHPLGFYLPREADIPLKRWMEARAANRGESGEGHVRPVEGDGMRM